MHKGRFEAFSDGVIAIILTIMVLELKVPREPTLDALAQLWPVWIAYALSYYNVFSLWVEHHEALMLATEVDRPVLFANGLFLFCASLIPFATAFAGEAHWSARLPVVLYGLVMVAVSLTLARLRSTVARFGLHAEAAAANQGGARRAGRQALYFLAGSLAALAHPRLGLVLFVAIPVGLRIAKGMRRRATA